MTETNLSAIENSATTTIAAEVASRRNFARSAETMAANNTPGFDSYLAKTDNTADIQAVQGPKGTANLTQMSYQDNDFSFSDVVDFLNPLQHIPVIGTLYREATGDTDIKPYAQVAGDLLFGGAIGGIAGMIISPALTSSASIGNATIAQTSGASGDKQIANALFGPDSASPTPVKLANATATNPAPYASFNKKVAAKKPTDAELKAKVMEGVQQAKDQMQPKKQAYGGVMDVAASQRAAILAESNGLQVGKNLYTKPLTSRRTAAQTAATQATASQKSAAATSVAPKQATALTMGETIKTEATKTASTAPSTNIADSESKQLGVLMHENAQRAQAADQVGAKNALPPELIQDMMLMALDKYQTANNLGTTTQQ